MAECIPSHHLKHSVCHIGLLLARSHSHSCSGPLLSSGAFPSDLPACLRSPPPKPAAKRKAWNDAGNARSLARRGAVRLLNGLAQELGLKPVPVKSRAARVEALVRLLERRCQSDGYPRRLAAVAQYVDNGGMFSVPMLATASAAESSCDVDTDPTPTLGRHRVLDEGFRLQSKAFMLTYNSRSFSTGTWPVLSG